MSDSEEKDSMGRAKKWIFGVAALLVLLILVGIVAERYLESYLEQRIHQEAASMAGDRYAFSMDDLHLSLWRQSVAASGLQLVVDSAYTDSGRIQHAAINTIEINQIGWFSYLTRGTISVGSVLLQAPNIVLKGQPPDSTSQPSSRLGSQGISNFPPIRIAHFRITDASGQLIHRSDSSVKASIGNMMVQISSLEADSSSISTMPYIRYDSFQVNASKISSQTPEQFYDITLESLNLSSRNSTLTFDSLAVKPKYPKYIFSQQFGFETDRIDLEIGQIGLTKFDVNQLFNKELRAGHLLVENAIMEIFHDKRMPTPNKAPKPLPHKALKKLPFTVDIDTVSVDPGYITYTEHRPRISEPGTVTFEALYATIYNLSNDSTIASPPIVLDARTSLMGAAPLNVRATFPMDDTDTHTVTGSLGNMEMNELNAVLEPLAFVSISSGEINTLEFDMQLSTEKANGTVLMNYSDLSIEVLDKDNIAQEEEKELISFLANALKIKSDNDAPPLREGTVLFERDPQKSIFNYWWKSLLTGLKESIGL